MDLTCISACRKECPFKELRSIKEQIAEALKFGNAPPKKRKFKDVDLLKINKLTGEFVEQLDLFQFFTCPKWQKKNAESQAVIVIALCNYISGIINFAEHVQSMEEGKKPCQKKNKVA